MSTLSAKKSVESLQSDGHGGESLTRALGPWRLLALRIGAVIGACAFAGLGYAELAALIPVAGSAYTYAYATLGELVALGWSGYVVSFLSDLGRHVPPRLTAAPGVPTPHTHLGGPVQPARSSLVIWLVIGLLLYFGHGRHHSNLAGDKKAGG